MKPSTKLALIVQFDYYMLGILAICEISRAIFSKSTMMDLLEFLKNQKILLLDGAMGTELDKLGLMSRGRNNLDNPQAVLDIHRKYCQ
ncbi:MAG: hypothetical protein ACYSSI_08960, partial [Planctomycetota bacterium]